MAATTRQRDRLAQRVAVILLGIALLLGPSAPAFAEALTDEGDGLPDAELIETEGETSDEEQPIALEDATIALADDVLVYTGEPQQPAVTVTATVDGIGVALEADAAYVVSYEDNTSVGTARVVVTAVEGGPCTGSAMASFQIVTPDKAQLEEAIADARAAVDGMTVSEDGSGLEVGTTYVAQADLDALDSAIADAQGVHEATDVTEAQVAEAVQTLNDAVRVFLDATKTVPKPTVALPEAIGGLIYDGNEQTGVAAGDGYVVEGATATDAGEHTALVSLTDADATTWPDGSVEPKEIAYTIAPAPIESANVSLSASSFTYDATAKKPGIASATIELAGTAVDLASGTDYTVSYKNNVNAGTATATITGTGNFTGSVSKTFAIKPMSIAGGTFELKWSSCTYQGDAKKPALSAASITLADKTVSLASGTDYTVSYKNNVKAGTATVTITGKGNFTGSVSRKLTIKPMSIAGGTFALKWSSCTYKGDAKKPGIKTAAVKIDGKTVALKSGTDYTVSYKNNVNAGTATVTITGKGNFTGSVSRKLTIKKAKLTSASFTNIAAQLYTGKALKPSPTIKWGSTKLKNGTDFTVSYKNNVKLGKATATVTGKGNFYGSKTMTFTIYQRNIKNVSVASIGTQSYTGSNICPNPTVKYNGKALRKGTDYTVSYKNNRYGGTASLTISGKGGYKGSKTVSFRINGPKYYGRTVYITDTGSKYHRSGCRYLYSRHAVDLGEARWEGYDACKVCRP